MRLITPLMATLLLSACSVSPPENTTDVATANVYEAVGGVTTTRPDLISSSATVEKLGGDFGWSEGPVYIPEMDAVLFTDVPGNVIWKFSETEGLTNWKSPSGGVADRSGANGLIRYDADHIIAPDHGSRTLYKLNLKTKALTPLAERYQGKRFNSPNDAVLHRNGTVFFTDPPYGLAGQDESPDKELDFNGVFALSPDGTITVVDDVLTRPNGVILSPDERTLYVANSDPEAAFWKSYPVSASGVVGTGQIIQDATADLKAGLRGNPDGMAMAEDGTIFATGPGGVLILSAEGERLGLISTGTAIANVTFGGADGRDLYMTSHSFLARTRTEVKGHGF